HHLSGAPFGQRPSGDSPMPDVAIGAGNKFDVMAECGPFGRRSSSGDLAVVGMGAEEDDPELSIGGRQGAFSRGETNRTGGEQTGETTQGQRDKAAAGNETTRRAFESVHKQQTGLA